MSSPSPNQTFLSLIPTAHRVAVISALASPAEEEVVIQAVQKTQRSSSTTSTESNAAEEPTLPVVDKTPVAAPVDIVKVNQFLKLGN